MSGRRNSVNFLCFLLFWWSLQNLILVLTSPYISYKVLIISGSSPSPWESWIVKLLLFINIMQVFCQVQNKWSNPSIHIRKLKLHLICSKSIYNELEYAETHFSWLYLEMKPKEKQTNKQTKTPHNYVLYTELHTKWQVYIGHEA